MLILESVLTALTSGEDTWISALYCLLLSSHCLSLTAVDCRHVCPALSPLRLELLFLSGYSYLSGERDDYELLLCVL